MGMAREWGRQGHEVHVLTGPGTGGGEPSPDLLAAALETNAVVHRTEPGASASSHGITRAARTGSGQGTPGTYSRLKQIFYQWARFPDQQRDWIPPTRALAR